LAISSCDTHFKNDLRRNGDGDRPIQPAYEIFTIKPKFQQSKFRPLKFKEAGAGGRQTLLPPSHSPLKVVIFLPQLSRVAWKRLQVGTDMLLIITSNSDTLFIDVNVDDLEW